MTILTQHAAIRSQQRGVPFLIREWLLDYGAVTVRHGAQIRYFDKKARRRLQHDVGAQVIDRLGNLLDMYLVESESEAVITVGHRTKSIKKK